MKKLIQICSLLSLLVFFSASAALAKTNSGTDVNIPFSFNVGDRTYEAGNYIVKLEKRLNGSATLSIQDTKTDEIQTVLMNVGPHSTSGELNLVFDMINGQRYLTKVRTSERTFALVKSKAEKNALKAQAGAQTSIIGG